MVALWETEESEVIEKMPLQLQTVGQFARKQQLEDKLKEVEQALVTFNKPEIYVALD